MVKSFNFGIVFGIAATAAALWFVPAVDQHREPSIVAVEANGGNRETFHVNLPDDRIVAHGGGAAAVPAELHWPASAVLAGVEAEVFKLRDAHDVVVGLASRLAGPGDATGSVLEWSLHLPARGTVYAVMQPGAPTGDYREGVLRAGTREFAKLEGRVLERYVPDVAADGGRIELTTVLVGVEEPEA
ncbi:MAG TPA: hypothetical protein VF200_05930 [Woeseiaceae bacterium]